MKILQLFLIKEDEVSTHQHQPDRHQRPQQPRPEQSGPSQELGATFLRTQGEPWSRCSRSPSDFRTLASAVLRTGAGHRELGNRCDDDPDGRSCLDEVSRTLIKARQLTVHAAGD